MLEILKPSYHDADRMCSDKYSNTLCNKEIALCSLYSGTSTCVSLSRTNSYKKLTSRPSEGKYSVKKIPEINETEKNQIGCKLKIHHPSNSLIHAIRGQLNTGRWRIQGAANSTKIVFKFTTSDTTLVIMILRVNRGSQIPHSNHTLH